jgi:hypothetical protein
MAAISFQCRRYKPASKMGNTLNSKAEDFDGKSVLFFIGFSLADVVIFY